MMHLQQHSFRSYAIAAKVKRGNILPALWWDSGNVKKNSTNPPYHYVRLQKMNEDYDLLICGGEDHRTGEEDNIAEEVRFSVLETWARKRFDFEEVIYKWSGQVHETMDGLAFIGRNPLDKSNVYIATGFSGNGITYGAIAGMLISDLVNGKENKWEKLYAPSRISLKAGGKVLKEIFSGALGAIQNKFTDTEHAVLDKIKPNEAKIIKHNGTFYGVYRDHENHLHMVDAKCTHLGCTVKWNNSEKSWDCPCHGSRFSHTGEVMNGPANHNLVYHSIQSTVNSEHE
jgi:Rieske Fe-S protein